MNLLASYCLSVRKALNLPIQVGSVWYVGTGYYREGYLLLAVDIVDIHANKELDKNTYLETKKEEFLS